MITESSFKPPWWLSNPHLQTIWPVLFRRRPNLPGRRQRVELADGDFTDIVWIGDNSGPTVLVLHGLEGSIRSHYAGQLLNQLEQAGFRPEKHVFQMRMQMDVPLLAPDWPAGIMVPTAHPEQDARAVHKLIQAAFDRPDRRPQPFGEWQTNMMRSDIFDAEL